MTKTASAASDTEISVTLNGEARALPAGLSLAAMLTHLGLNPRKVAVERNLEIAPRSAYGTIEVQDGDRLEIVQFVGGG